jgi:hypothetical protein
MISKRYRSMNRLVEEGGVTDQVIAGDYRRRLNDETAEAEFRDGPGKWRRATYALESHPTVFLIAVGTNRMRQGPEGFG